MGGSQSSSDENKQGGGQCSGEPTEPAEPKDLPATAIVLCGMAFAGKTTAFWKLKDADTFLQEASVGGAYDASVYQGHRLVKMETNSWDMLHMTAEGMLKKALEGVAKVGIVFVIDASTPESLTGDESCSTLLDWVLAQEGSHDAPVLVLCNQQDKDGALSPQEVTRRMDLAAKMGSRPFAAHACEAVNNQGLTEALGWLTAQLRD